MTDRDREVLTRTATNVEWIREALTKQDARLNKHSSQINWIKKYVYLALGAIGLLEFLRMR